MIEDEPGFKDNFKALLMTHRGYHIPLVVKHVVSLVFEVLGTHFESIYACPFNTKKSENKIKISTKRY